MMPKTPAPDASVSDETVSAQPDAIAPQTPEAPTPQGDDERAAEAPPPPVRAYGVLTRRRGELIDGQIIFVEGPDAAAAAEALAALDDLVIPATDAQVAAAGHFLFPLPPA
jgi:hypothetical protein